MQFLVGFWLLTGKTEPDFVKVWVWSAQGGRPASDASFIMSLQILPLDRGPAKGTLSVSNEGPKFYSQTKEFADFLVPAAICEHGHH